MLPASVVTSPTVWAASKRRLAGSACETLRVPCAPTCAASGTAESDAARVAFVEAPPSGGGVIARLGAAGGVGSERVATTHGNGSKARITRYLWHRVEVIVCTTARGREERAVSDAAMPCTIHVQWKGLFRVVLANGNRVATVWAQPAVGPYGSVRVAVRR